jgi:hypothetical protein
MHTTIHEIRAQLDAQDRAFEAAAKRLRDAPSDAQFCVDRADLEAIDEAAAAHPAPAPANPGLRC